MLRGAAMIKVYAIIAGVILALSVGLYYSLSGLFTARAEVKATNALLVQAKASNAALEAFTVSLQEQVKKSYMDASQSRQGIEHALSKEAEWRDAAVPADVTSELCKHLNCIPAQTD